MRHNSKRQPQSQTLLLTKTSHWLAAAAAGNRITETFKSIKRTHAFTCTQLRVVAQAQALAGLWHVILEDYDLTVATLHVYVLSEPARPAAAGLSPCRTRSNAS